MKKLLTTFFMMAVTLGCWATVEEDWNASTGVLKITYATGDNLDNVKNYLVSHNGAVKELVLDGDYTNGDLISIGDQISNCAYSEGFILNLTACTKMMSYVKYNGEGDEDWTSKDFTYMPDPANPETVTVKGKADKSYKYYYSYGVGQDWGLYTGEVIEKDGNYFDTNNQPLVRVDAYVDENGKYLPSDAEVTKNDDNTYSYSYTYTLDATQFVLGNYKTKLVGIYFPDNEHFTAIPKEICVDMNGEGGNGNLKVVKFGSKLQWIGNDAFKNCSNLANVTFPTSLKVIGSDAFYGCVSFTKVDLSALSELVKIDYAAFNMVDIEKNNLTTVLLPTCTATKPNTNLQFFANQVFASSHVKTLDFSNFHGIYNFAYDGKNTFGEGTTTMPTFDWLVDLEELILPPMLTYVPGGDNGFTPDCWKLKTVTFTGSAKYKDDCTLDNPLIIGQNAFSFIQQDQTVNVNTDNTGAKLRLLNSVTFSNNIIEIGVNAFYHTSLTEVHIPASVETIYDGAFDNCSYLTKVYFDEIDANCKCGETTNKPKGEETEIAGSGEASGGAFKNCRSITDVYVNTPELLNCKNGAFTKDITVGQTDINIQKATLHFPEGDKYVQHYVNMNHLLDEETANDAGALQAWLNAHWDVAQNTGTGYGWYEFVSSGPSDITVSGDAKVILRTFSDYKYARLVPNGLRAYIVTNVKKNTKDQYEITLKRLNVIPRQTGVILYGQPNSKDETGVSALTLTPVNYEGKPLTRARWESGSETYDSSYDTNYINYLEPCLTEDGSEVTVYPYEPYRSGKTVEWRNFGLSKFNETKTLHTKSPLGENESDFYSFFRLLKGDYTSGYAYLHMRASEFKDAEGAECIIIKDDDYSVEYTTQSTSGSSSEEPSITGVNYDQLTNLSDNPLQYWQFAKWDVIGKGFGYRPNRWNETHFVQYLGEMEDSADGIEQLSVSTIDSNADCYTLQGVKVSNPSKGVYIKNGKKMIIK